MHSILTDLAGRHGRTRRPGGRGAGGGARRGRGWAGPLGSVMLTSRPAEMGTKGDGATITHERGG